MKKRKIRRKAPRNLFIFFLFVLILLYGQYLYVALFPEVYGRNMQEFADSRNIFSQTLYAKRGTIYDADNNILALDVSSYKVVAYLDPSRSGESNTLYHVEDIEKTATILTEVLGGTVEYYKNILDPDYYLYQTYLGYYGNNISEITKTELENMELPGIEFESSFRRYYPNGDFASYNIGYAKTSNSFSVTIEEEYNLVDILKPLITDTSKVTFKSNSDKINISGSVLSATTVGEAVISIYVDGQYIDNCNVIISDTKVITALEEKIYGELGIESYYDSILRGNNGYISYQADRFGYKIPGSNEDKIEPVEGSDIYLTLDSNIQRMVETAVEETNNLYEPEWITFTVMDAKTGEILGNTSTPSFNPNDLSTITNYENPLTSFLYEPGSVMKIYTYMCALENNVYDGDDTFLSGNLNIEGDYVYDWNRYGWGEITYDLGFAVSSNVAVSMMMQEDLTKEQLYDCFTKYGFGDTTGIDLPREFSGELEFTYPYEVASASFGQGITTTPIQQLQALTLVANNGTMVTPSIIKSIENEDGIIETEIQKEENIVSEETIDYIKMLMYDTVHGDPNLVTGDLYKVEGADVIGKTSTAQVYNSETGLYESDDYIYSFGGMFPYDDPEIIVFASIKKPNKTSSSTLSEMVQPVLESVAKYIGVIESNVEIDSYQQITLDYYQNKDISVVAHELEIKDLEVLVLGTGTTVIDQYPIEGTKVLTEDLVILKTNSEITMPSLIGYSRKEVISILQLLDIEFEITGTGNVSSQSIEEGQPLGKILIELE